MERVVISGFPGIGKSFLSKKYNWQDSDSSKFSWLKDGSRNPEFPQNYINHLKPMKGYVMVSSHKEVRDAMFKNPIEYNLVYPARECKGEYIERYLTRGSPDKFIDNVDKSWDTWISDVMNDKHAKKHFVLGPGQFLIDIIDKIEK